MLDDLIFAFDVLTEVSVFIFDGTLFFQQFLKVIFDNLLLPLYLFMTLLNLGYHLCVVFPTELQFFFEFEYVSGARLNPSYMLLFCLVISLK